ncbi:IPT/TIG domain-containing protein [Streptomyces sp. FH025]|uniref:IPT/TIG domain-containing protein n=1 Tax=Streptomyces sp. FH025 TaxID=2815937 RepID=UPI001A9DE902|nr:IPT/TIG domain-containing protein [Streptomyces sp. FH025]MBO1417203.1 IPT/TIG domain-containing protein [Streptomyces sp. FH025]
MTTRLAKAGLAVLSVTALSTGAAVAAPADVPSTSAQHVTVSQGGNYPGGFFKSGNMTANWVSSGTSDLTGPTHFTVDLPPGVTTDGGMFYSTPYDYTFTETLSADHRRLEAVLTGTRVVGKSEFIKLNLFTTPGVPIGGVITVTAANPNDTDPTGHVSRYDLGSQSYLPATVQAAPAVTGLDTTTGPGAGGTSVTVSGSNLSNGMVLVGGVPAPGTCTDTACTVTTPGGSGSAPVSVVTPGGTATAPAAFDYTGAAPPAPPAPVVSNLTTTSGPVAGGTQVYLQGSNLTYGSVTFGGVPAAHVSCGPSFCSATAPAAATPGPVDVTVTTAGGTSAAVTYTYTA